MFRDPEIQATSMRQRGVEAARRLFDFSRRWGQELALFQPLTAQPASLADEVLAYGLCRLDMVLKEEQAGIFGGMAEGIKGELLALKADAGVFGRSNEKDSGPVDAYLVGYTRRRGHALTPEVFKEFQLSTGIGSSVFVGNGCNLASLVFYLALHAALAPLTREQLARMLKEARRCRTELEKVVRLCVTGQLPTQELKESSACSGFRLSSGQTERA